MDGAPLQHRWRYWFLNSVAPTAASAKHQLAKMGLLQSDGRSNLQLTHLSNTGLQSALYKALRKIVTPSDLEGLLRSRVARCEKVFSKPIGRIARRGLPIIECLRNDVPPCVIAAVIRSWLNGWCTGGFQQGRGQCWHSDTCFGDDSSEHYSRCPWAWMSARRRLQLNESPRSLGRFLLFEAPSEDDIKLLALNLYAIYSATNDFRARGHRARGEESHHRIVAAYGQVTFLNARLAKRVKNIWAGKRCMMHA